MLEQHTFKLVGIKTDHKPARIGSEVFGFISENNQIAVSLQDNGTVAIVTKNGRNFIKKSVSQNMYVGIVNDIRIHVILKKISGKVIAWY